MRNYCTHSLVVGLRLEGNLFITRPICFIDVKTSKKDFKKLKT